MLLAARATPLAAPLLRTQFWDAPIDDNAVLVLGERGGVGDASPFSLLHVSWTDWKNTFSMEIACETAKLAVDGLVRSYGPQQLRIYKMRPELGPPDLEEVLYPDEDVSWVKPNGANFKGAIDRGDAPSRRPRVSPLRLELRRGSPERRDASRLDLRGQAAVLVTGASRGIGRPSRPDAAAAGAELICVARDQEHSLQALRIGSPAGPHQRSRRCDVSDEDAWDARRAGRPHQPRPSTVSSAPPGSLGTDRPTRSWARSRVGSSACRSTSTSPGLCSRF